MKTLTLIEKGDSHVVFARDFAAPPQAVYDAHTKAEIIEKWMFGPDGGSVRVRQLDLTPGGSLHFDCSAGNGYQFAIMGEFLRLDPPHRIEHVERMKLPGMEPEVTPDNHCVTTFADHAGGTRLTIRMQVPDAASLEAMLASGMDQGMEASYARIDAFAPA